MTLGKKSFENKVEKGENAGYRVFSFSHYVFYQISNKNHHLDYI